MSIGFIGATWVTDAPEPLGTYCRELEAASARGEDLGGKAFLCLKDDKNILQKVGAPVVKLANDVVSSFEDLAAKVPGVSELADVAGDFAKTTVGQIVTRAIATALYGSLAFVVGPQLAAVSFAVPGLMTGEQFDKAWLAEFKWRCEEAAKILGPEVAELFGQELKKAIVDLAERYHVGDRVAETAIELAGKLHIREDVAELAITKFEHAVFDQEEYDLTTGRKKIEARARLQEAGLAQAVVGFGATAAGIRQAAIVTAGAYGGQSASTLAVKQGSLRAAMALAPAAPMGVPNMTAVRATAPPSTPAIARSRMIQDVALVGVVGAAIGALIWWSRSHA